ncbi:MAG: M14 family zinc carboxypeptidase [Candidatus Eisenbacteria bacterium]|nr:M14 family zinc carboxypeptidase [Candidatus Eisenbacteria bacterium]
MHSRPASLLVRVLAVLLPAVLVILAPALCANAADAARQIARIEGTTASDNSLLIDLGFQIAAARPGEWTDVLVSPEDLDRLERIFPVSRVDDLPAMIPAQYHDYGETLTALQQMVLLHPTIAKLEDIGDGWSKTYNDPDWALHDVWALKISDNVQVDEPEPAILYSGVHHAREPVTVEICLGIATELLNGYGVDPQITRFINDHETWIVPIVNVDGHWCVTDLNYTSWRKNCRDNDGNGYPTPADWWSMPDGVDLNRNYSWHWGGLGSDPDPSGETYKGPSPFSEPETQATRALALRENFSFSIDYHSYGEEVMYPYGYDYSTQAPDNALLSQISQAVRDRIGGNYVSMQANQLYPAAGNSQDWHYGENNCFAWIIETATEFIPPGTAIPGIVTPNVRGALYLQERVDGPGVRGTVRINGVPGLATVRLMGIDNPALANSRHSHPVLGDYYRLTAPGNQTLRFSAPGFDDQEFAVNVPADGYVTLDVNFGPSAGVADAGHSAGSAILAASPNPLRGGTGVDLSWQVPAGAGDGTLTICDTSGRIVARRSITTERGSLAWNGRADDGRRIAAGVYFARLSCGGRAEVSKRLVVLPE